MLIIVKSESNTTKDDSTLSNILKTSPQCKHYCLSVEKEDLELAKKGMYSCIRVSFITTILIELKENQLEPSLKALEHFKSNTTSFNGKFYLLKTHVFN